eukprot:1098736-Prymnesium_polylepis.1
MISFCCYSDIHSVVRPTTSLRPPMRASAPTRHIASTVNWGPRMVAWLSNRVLRVLSYSTSRYSYSALV